MLRIRSSHAFIHCDHCSISSIPRADRRMYWSGSVGMTFGLTTFSLAVLVLLQDRSQRCLETFHFTKAKDGYYEGGTLIACVLWWIVGVGYTTRAGGIAYVATNIYFSAWLALFSCVYTLNEWSASKDILSIKELTGLSTTLKSWWVLSLTSLVVRRYYAIGWGNLAESRQDLTTGLSKTVFSQVLGSCIDLHIRLARNQIDDTSFGVAMSVVSFVISFFFILVHYDFIPHCEEGGWLELSSSFFLILLWTIALAIMTKDQGIAATISGSQCSRYDISPRAENCTIVLYERKSTHNGHIFQQVDIGCNDLSRKIPGSNLYFALWLCFFASLNISFRWKAQQALQFAQTQQEKRQRQLASSTNNSSTDQGENEEEEEEVHL